MPIGRSVLSRPPQVAAGLRDKYVRIETLTAGRGVSGFPTETWTTLANEYMHRRDLRADERFVANQQSAYAEVEWHMLYREDMDPELVDVAKARRLVYQGRVYQIITAALMDRRQGIEVITLSGGTLA